MSNRFNPCSDADEAELPLRADYHDSKSRKKDLILDSISEKTF